MGLLCYQPPCMIQSTEYRVYILYSECVLRPYSVCHRLRCLRPEAVMLLPRAAVGPTGIERDTTHAILNNVEIRTISCACRVYRVRSIHCTGLSGMYSVQRVWTTLYSILVQYRNNLHH